MARRKKPQISQVITFPVSIDTLRGNTSEEEIKTTFINTLPEIRNLVISYQTKDGNVTTLYAGLDTFTLLGMLQHSLSVIEDNEISYAQDDVDTIK